MAVSASISTPVRALVATVASISTPSFPRTSSIEACVSGSGCASGMSSLVRFAAMVPARGAAASTSPFGIAPSRTSASVEGETRSKPRATARRSVTAFAPTSTIRAAPLESMCVSFFCAGLTCLISRSSCDLRLLGQDHVDELALLDPRWADRQIDEAIRERHRTEDPRALWSGEANGARLRIKNAAREEAQRSDLVDRLDQARFGPRPRHVRAPLHPKERRADEHLEGHERGHGVSGQSEDRHAAVTVPELAERERTARPDGDRPEVDLAELGEHRLQVIVVADRHAAARHDGVRRDPFAESRSQRIRRVRDDVADPRLGAGGSDRRGEGISIGVADLPALEGCIELDYLVPRGEP